MATMVEIPDADEIRARRDGGDLRVLDEVMVALEIARRQVEAAIVACVAAADETAAWSADGHRSSTSWSEAISGVSRATAHGRARCARFRPLGLHRWAAAVATATIGVEQAALLGAVATNPRVRAHVHDSESLLLDLARSLPFRTFARAVDHWTRLADQDGSLGAHERADACRSLSMATVGERFVLRAECGTAQGAIISQLLARFVERELRSDLDTADEGAPLVRTARQRALDALVVALEHAASSDSNSVEPVVNLVCDATTMLEWVRWGIGGRHPVPDPSSVEARRCHSASGAPVDPRVMVEAAVSGRFRVVITGEGQPIAVRPTTRLFPAVIRDAIRATGVECLWPGCDRPAALAEVDHLHPHARGGRSTADNAGPACHAHNRFKADRWYATRRRGVTTIRRPDGSVVTDRPPPGPG